MLRPILILDHHFDQTPFNFLAQNLKSLQSLGYQKILLEMNVDVDINDFIKQNQLIASNPFVPDHYRNSCAAMVALLETAKTVGVEIVFVDPEIQKDAANLSFVAAATRDSEVLKRFDEVRDERDKIMAARFIIHSQYHAGGIIGIFGFTHKDLLRYINESQELFNINPCYLIVSNFDKVLLDNSLDNEIWGRICDEQFRMEYYQTDVRVISHPEKLSFAVIESLCVLSEKRSVESYLGELFEKSLDNATFSFQLDSFGVLSANKYFQQESDLVCVSEKIKQKFPSLLQLSKRKENEIQLEVHGLNLDENDEALCSEFQKMGLMKRTIMRK